MLRSACRASAARGPRRTLVVVAPVRGYAHSTVRVAQGPAARAAPSSAVVCAPRSAPMLSVTTVHARPVLRASNRGYASQCDKIKAGEVIAEIETDKAAVAFEYQDEAYLAKILYPKGATDIPVGVPIAVMVDKAEDVAKFKDFKAPEAAAKKPAAAAAPTPAPAPAPAAAPRAAPAAAPAPAPAAPGGRVFASPLAKSIAREAGLDLATIAGTGPGGRVIAADVQAAKAQPRAAAAPAVAAAAHAPAAAPAAAAAAATVVGDYTDIPNSNIRRVIASRLSQSKQTIPHYYLTIDARVDKLQKLRAELNGKAEKDAFKLSVNDFVIKAAALACKKVPDANSSWSENAIRRFHNVHVNVAVATEQGLLTPVVRDADRSGLASISNSVRRLAEKAKAGKLTPMDLEIGTFTISNLGMFGIKNFSAVILPPQACILAVGTTEKRLIPGDAPAKGDEFPITTAEFMSFTLSCDHRVVDGAVGAEWLKAFKEYIEDPVKMLL